jgi:hypothetical protein
MNRFSGHDKRVTLHLALHSAVARTIPGLIEALGATEAAGWDLALVPQAAVEVIYATFDEAFEKLVVSEFEADPSYLIDLGTGCPGTCPLCGHNPIRWVFRVVNHREGGSAVECGSECIVTWGISVKGAETAEAARAILESQIRKAIRRLLIEGWHKETGFSAGWFAATFESLERIRAHRELPYNVRNGAWHKRRDMRKLERFYNRTGWLNTEIRWNELARIVNFCRANDTEIKLPFLAPFVPKAAATKAAIEAGTIKTEALAPKGKPVDVRPVGTLELPLSPKVEAAPEVEMVPEIITPIYPEPEMDAEAAAREAELAWVREQAAKDEPINDGAPYAPGEEAKVVAAFEVTDVMSILGKALVDAADAALTQAADLAECKLAKLESEADGGITLDDRVPEYAPPPSVPKSAQLALDFSAVCRELVFRAK